MSATNFPPKDLNMARFPVACPTVHCAAPIGVACRTRENKKASKTHTPRIDAIHAFNRRAQRSSHRR